MSPSCDSFAHHLKQTWIYETPTHADWVELGKNTVPVFKKPDFSFWMTRLSLSTSPQLERSVCQTRVKEEKKKARKEVREMEFMFNSLGSRFGISVNTQIR